MFEGQIDSTKRINLLYDEVERHYHVIVNITGAMAKKYVCKACNKGGRRDVTHMCDQTCSVCMAGPPCAFSAVTIPCSECNTHFRSKRVSRTTNRVPRIRNPFVNADDVALRVGPS